ncbi:DUF6920 family protein [Hydrogenimonas thermophila]|uniref:Uncharacterized protein n=1 Tax=Hydrogenimonas thermophila TaxID=223786 RepID=A0A1I5UN20_9BACT|nr:DUF6544 family protein [Hydrogenimonas thermophila]WOE71013.1 DUF6544 family protein [Hydrogenimonas thermophila]WOE73531.1 DUF6544 family protein [Hydrogenimonas thermophila]SFP96714.1 hypothetical protein SAMN05216234_1665 [Hydrogenimonas thermophila]
MEFVVIIIGLVVILVIFGYSRWQIETDRLYSKLSSNSNTIKSLKYNSDQLNGLPKPVQRYFKTVLKEGQSMVSSVTIEHTGTFNMSETGEFWRPFSSIQRVTIDRPGFVWSGKIKLIPALAVCVNDAYIAGKGLLKASFAGLISLVKEEGSCELNRGELMRFFAESAWYPTALLPTQGVRWEEVNSFSARAVMRDGEISVTLLFSFNDYGLIESVYADARGRSVKGEIVLTPWEGRWSRYEVHNGMLIPTEGEVAWILPDGRKPYWRGRIEKIDHKFS